MYLFHFILALVATLAITPLVKRLAIKTDCVDLPNVPRKIHTKPMPLLGGLAVFAVFALVVFVYLLWGQPNFDVVPLKFFLAILGGGAVLMLGGALDDRYRLSARQTVWFPAIACLIIVLSGIGIGITFLTNPFGGTIPLDYFVLGIPVSGIFVWLWLMGMVYTTKLLDGLDGLASGVGLIGSLTMFFLSLTDKVNQPVTATLAIILAGCLAGYLFYAFNPASIFLGESGSTFIGFTLGVLSVLSGAKIATALLVMGIPILDVAWAIARRLWYRSSPFIGDRQHLHFRLLDVGLSHRQAVLLLYTMSAIFGFTAVFMQSRGKLIALGLLILVTLTLLAVLAVVLRYRSNVKEGRHGTDEADSRSGLE